MSPSGTQACQPGHRKASQRPNGFTAEPKKEMATKNTKRAEQLRLSTFVPFVSFVAPFLFSFHAVQQSFLCVLCGPLRPLRASFFGPFFYAEGSQS
jgi:hypothetical protein